MLKFLKYFILILGKAFQSHSIEEFSKQIPNTANNAYTCIGIVCNTFIEYVVCPSCHSVYEYQDCIQVVHGEKQSKNCSHIFFPNHPQLSRRKPCGTTLLKKVKSGRGCRLIPIKTFPYMSLKTSLQSLASRPGFITACEQWRGRATTSPNYTYLRDIYDGKVWHDFHSFLSQPFSYLLTLNVDWFQPFKHTQYSVGAIYLTVQNLPRNIRCKEENVILIGVIPGPSEPNLVMNSYLSPLVEELMQGWENGFPVTTSENVNINIRVALSCIACDIPASRKVCGFLGHNAALACNKCLKKFSVTFGAPNDYSGYDRENWTARSNKLHRQQCQAIFREKTKTGIRKMESKYGLRYSVLLNLPYFDPVRFTAIDTMHNLYLGTGKHAFKVWIAKNILNNQSLLEIDHKARCFQVPAGVGRLPLNVCSNYGGFKADQWRTWITVYSPIVLKGILPNQHLHCWLIFVRACSILSRRVITQNDLSTADLLLVNYCKKFEQLYGKEHTTMNQHLHLHIRQTMVDYGPSHAFWCFPFERYNGILGSYITNMKAVEVQFMRKFTTSQYVKALSRFVNPQLSSLLPTTHFQNVTAHTVAKTIHGDELDQLYNARTSLTPFRIIDVIEVFHPICEFVFPSEDVLLLESLYKQLFPDSTITFTSPFYQRSTRVSLAGDLLGSVHNAASASASSVIMAFWPGRGIDLSAINYSRMRVGVVQYYFKHYAIVCSQNNIKEKKYIHFACVHWKQRHPNEDWFGNSATVCFDMYESPSVFSFIPVQIIANKCAYCNLTLEIIPNVPEKLFVACPVPVRYSL